MFQLCNSSKLSQSCFLCVITSTNTVFASNWPLLYFKNAITHFSPQKNITVQARDWTNDLSIGSLVLYQLSKSSSRVQCHFTPTPSSCQLYIPTITSPFLALVSAVVTIPLSESWPKFCCSQSASINLSRRTTGILYTVHTTT